jgi:hypothetical protein
MKQLVARTISEVLYCLGDWVSLPMLSRDWAGIYPVYNWLMDASYRTQVWGGGAGPWQVNTIKDVE